MGTSVGIYPGANEVADFGGVFVSTSIGGAVEVGGTIDVFHDPNKPVSDSDSYGGGFTFGMGFGGLSLTGIGTKTIIGTPHEPINILAITPMIAAPL